MLAAPERVPGYGRAPDRTIWHKPSNGHRCTDDCDFHPIACSTEEGIVAPAPKRDVPLRLDRPGESWCPACLDLIQAKASSTAYDPRSTFRPSVRAAYQVVKP